MTPAGLTASRSCSAARPGGLPAAPGIRHRTPNLQQPRSPAAPLSSSHPRRHQRLQVCASVPKTALSTYRLGRQPSSADWFQAAVRDIVKRVDRTPFLQLVQLGSGATLPRFLTVPVADSVVPVPELWRGIAEHESSSQPDVVILVQHVDPTHHAPARAANAAAEEAAAWSAAAGQPTASGDYCEPPAGSSGSSSSSGAATNHMRGGGCGGAAQRVEAACRRLVQSGLAESLVTGKVGDCCEGPGHSHSHGHAHGPGRQQQQQQPQGGAAAAGNSGSGSSAIVPFLAAGLSRRARAVQVAALGSGSAAAPAACSQDTCYYGMVVQSSSGRATGVEGCYLLKTVRNVSPTGCMCTHFSLTKIGAGEHLEQQFIHSWLQ